VESSAGQIQRFPGEGDLRQPSRRESEIPQLHVLSSGSDRREEGRGPGLRTNPIMANGLHRDVNGRELSL